MLLRPLIVAAALAAVAKATAASTETSPHRTASAVAAAVEATGCWFSCGPTGSTLHRLKYHNAPRTARRGQGERDYRIVRWETTESEEALPISPIIKWLF